MECAFLYRYFCHSVMQLNISMTTGCLKTCMWMASVNQRSPVAIDTVTYKHTKPSVLGPLRLKNEIDKHFKNLVVKPSRVISTDVYPIFSTILYGFVNGKPKSVWTTRQRNRTIFGDVFRGTCPVSKRGSTLCFPVYQFKIDSAYGDEFDVLWL